jgi:signal transduction histidine kinase
VEVEARHQPRHRLSNEIPGDLPVVKADPERISTAVQVLVSNAVLYSPAGGPVAITGQEEDGFVAISVRDHGVGIRNQDLPMLFRRFQRLNREATPNARGFGLGLSICKGIVEQHRGRVRVDSVYGEGSTFTLLLPVRGPAENRQVPLDI